MDIFGEGGIILHTTVPLAASFSSLVCKDKAILVNRGKQHRLRKIWVTTVVPSSHLPRKHQHYCTMDWPKIEWLGNISTSYQKQKRGGEGKQNKGQGSILESKVWN